jgi:single-stranded DNA-binding protein
MNNNPTSPIAGEPDQATFASSVQAIIFGRLIDKPKIRQTKHGRDFATATVIVDGKSDQPRYFRVLAFSDEIRDELAYPPEGAILRVQGALELSLYDKGEGEKPEISPTVIASRVEWMELKPIKRDRTSSSAHSPSSAASSIDDDIQF